MHVYTLFSNQRCTFYQNNSLTLEYFLSYCFVPDLHHQGSSTMLTYDRSCDWLQATEYIDILYIYVVYHHWLLSAVKYLPLRAREIM